MQQTCQLKTSRKNAFGIIGLTPRVKMRRKKPFEINIMHAVSRSCNTPTKSRGFEKSFEINKLRDFLCFRGVSAATLPVCSTQVVVSLGNSLRIRYLEYLTKSFSFSKTIYFDLDFLRSYESGDSSYGGSEAKSVGKLYTKTAECRNFLHRCRKTLQCQNFDGGRFLRSVTREHLGERSRLHTTAQTIAERRSTAFWRSFTRRAGPAAPPSRKAAKRPRPKTRRKKPFKISIMHTMGWRLKCAFANRILAWYTHFADAGAPSTDAGACFTRLILVSTHLDGYTLVVNSRNILATTYVKVLPNCYRKRPHEEGVIFKSRP